MDELHSPYTLYESMPLKGIRKIISGRLSAIWHEAVHVTLNKEIDITLLAAQRSKLPYSLIDYVYYGLVQTLKQNEYKRFNSHFDGATLQTYDSINLGLAMDHPKGLVVPVIHGSEACMMEQLAHRRKDLTERTRNWKQTPQEMEHGTFTVSNLGTLGIDFFTPILNPPQVAILGLGRVRMQTVSWNGETPTLKTTLPASLTFDHRVIDGADAAKFLVHLERQIVCGIG